MPGMSAAYSREANRRWRKRQAEKVKIAPASKICTACDVEKPADEFYRMSASNDGLQSYCIDCNKERRRGAHIRAHGLTPDRFDEMLREQNGRCAVCRQVPVRQGNVTWAIDHDHDCCPGETSCGACVRGLLCNSCNRGLGLFGDSVESLMNAAAYLLSKGV